MRVILLVITWAVSPGAAAAGRNLARIPCGKPGSDAKFRQGRIMGGTSANILEFPYAVSLQTAQGEHFCGGSLVHRSYVVTAAHCVDYATPELLVAGDQNSAMMDARTEQHLHAEKVFKHPDFSRKDLTNDIAVIKLREPVEWTDWVQPVCLPGPQENLKEGSPGYLVGWGYDDHYGEPTEDLHSVRLPIVSNEQCQNYLGSRINIRDSHLCAGHEEGQRDGCGADSGGGLISLKLGHMILSGVMMGGVGCGRPMLPGVYTRVQKYVKWIEDIVNENSPPSSFRKKRDVVDGNASYNPFEDDDHDDTNTAEEMVIKSYVQARSDRPQH